MREQIIQNGIRNLKEFGYPTVNEKNIFTDLIFGQMFQNMLIDNKGFNKKLDVIIDELLTEINIDDE